MGVPITINSQATRLLLKGYQAFLCAPFLRQDQAPGNRDKCGPVHLSELPLTMSPRPLALRTLPPPVDTNKTGPLQCPLSAHSGKDATFWVFIPNCQ